MLLLVVGTKANNLRHSLNQSRCSALFGMGALSGGKTITDDAEWMSEGYLLPPYVQSSSFFHLA